MMRVPPPPPSAAAWCLCIALLSVTATTAADDLRYRAHVDDVTDNLPQPTDSSADSPQLDLSASGKGQSCFQDNCRCLNNVANCSHNHGTLTFVPRLPRRIRHLLFSFNNLTDISQADFFQNVTDIVSVDLSHNGLRYIHPDAFQRLQKLETLLVHANRLTYPALEPVLSAPSLQSLNLGDNGLRSVPPDFFSRTPVLGLRELVFTGNPVQILNMSAFVPLPDLSSLVLADCEVIVTSGALLPRLKHLDLSANGLFHLPTSCHGPGSASLLPDLRQLDFAQNVFSGFHSDICLPDLRSLDLSKNPISVMRTDMFGEARFPQLTNLKLERIQTISELEQFAFRSPSLQLLSLYSCSLPFSDDFIHPDSFRGIPRLTSLQLSHNLGSYIPDPKFQQLFGSLENLQEFNIGVCGILEINANLFRNMSKLTKLMLYRNKLTEIPEGMFSSLKHLTVLSLGDNELTTVRESTFSEETRGRLKQLDLSGNRFVCDCDLVWFRDWYVSSTIFQGSFRDYNCSNLPHTPLAVFSMPLQACLGSHESYSAIIACFVTFLVLLSLLSTVHHYRWHIRLRLAFRGHGDLMRRRLETGRFHYDVFVSFAGEDVDWVREHLLPKLEGDWGLRLCIHERDFVPGKNILNNIVDSVKCSKKYLMVFSPHFLASPWCQFELELCLGHVMDYDDALIVTCLDDVTSRELTCTMTAVLRTTTYLQWRDFSPEDVALFWHRIGLAVRDLQA